MLQRWVTIRTFLVEIVMGISICSELDQFCKETGRTVSTGRALNQRKNNHGRRSISLYSSDIDNEFAGQAGFPENYFVGKETDVFISYVKNYNYFTKHELIQEFGLFKRTLIRVILLSPRIEQVSYLSSSRHGDW